MQPAPKEALSFRGRQGPFGLQQARNISAGGTVIGKIRKESETLTTFF
jgi:hypothetical protein